MEQKSFNIVILSYKRAGEVTSDKVFNNALIYVPNSQVEEYEKYEYENGAKVVGFDDKYNGNIARARNYILNEFAGKDVVMVDDDYSYLGCYRKGKAKRLTADEIDELIDNGMRMAKELGTVLWGLNVHADRQSYDEYAPFNFLSVVLAPFHAITSELPANIRYDERIPLKEDYDFSLQVLHKYHKVLKFKKYHYQVNHHNKKGGVVSYRTMQKEEEMNNILLRKWGSKVVSYDMAKSVNPKVKPNLKGI